MKIELRNEIIFEDDGAGHPVKIYTESDVISALAREKRRAPYSPGKEENIAKYEAMMNLFNPQTKQ